MASSTTKMDPAGIDFRTVFETGPWPCLLLEARAPWRIEAVTDAFLALARSTREMLVGKPLLEALAAAPSAPSTAVTRSLVESLERVVREGVADTMPAVRRDARLQETQEPAESRWWRCTNSPVRAAGGGVSFVLHRADDITEAKIADEERQLFVSLAENSADFIGIADPEGNPVWVNPAGRRMVGLDEDHPIAQTRIPDYYTADQREFAMTVILQAMLTAGRWSGETTFRNWKTEEPIPVSDEHFLIRRRGDGQVIGMGTITRDITERKRAEAFDAAQRALQARDDVLGVVAHDLRSPLSAIQYAARILEQHVGHEPGSRAPRAVETIVRSVRHANRMISDLLDVTRIEAGQLSINHDRIDAGEVLEEAVEAQRLPAAAAAVELRYEPSMDHLEVWGDRDRLGQVLENLVGNAIKFTPAGGHITLGARPGEEGVVFHVADTGVGISEEQRARVFERFWQAQRGTRRGAGLGLSICKGLVEAHGGRIWAESAPPGGTIFYFTIPRPPTAR